MGERSLQGIMEFELDRSNSHLNEKRRIGECIWEWVDEDGNKESEDYIVWEWEDEDGIEESED